MTRPGAPWVNVDSLRTFLAEGTPEREQVDALPNYVEADIREQLPFEDATFDGALLCHVLEHFDAQEGLALLIECYRVLLPGGVVLVSVPDASYFRRVHREDRNANWPRLFEINDPANPIPTFMRAALFFNEHKAILTGDAVWCFLTEAGFQVPDNADHTAGWWDYAAGKIMGEQLNRRIFSVEMIGVK